MLASVGSGISWFGCRQNPEEVNHQQTSVANCSQKIPSIKLTPHDVFYQTKQRLFGYSELGRQVRDIAAKEKINEADIQTLVKAFNSKEFPQLRHFFVRIIDQQAPEQINQLFKEIFKTHTFEDTKPLFKKLKNLFTLQKVEAAIQSEFSNFQGAEKTALQRSQAAKREEETKKAQKEHKLKSTIAYYITSTLDWFVDSVLLILQLKDVTDNDATKIEKQMVAQMRYMAFRENIAIIAGVLIGLAVYVGSAATAAAIAGLVTLSLIGLYAIYAKFIRGCPDKVHPGVNRTADASKGLLHKVYGRDEVVKRVFDTLEGNSKTNARRYPMIRGGTGVGKSDLGNAMSLYLTSPECPKEWRGKKLQVISCADLVTGGAHGKMEHLENMKTILEGYEGDAILFFNEVHVGFQEKTFFLGQELKTLCDPHGGFPYMIFATTNKEYMEHMAKDTAFARRLDFFDIESTSDEVTELVVGEMVTREASDIFILKEAIKEVAAIRSQEIKIDGKVQKVFENCPQPATSIAITAKVLADARHPWFADKEKALQDKKNERSLLDHQIKLGRGVNFLPYSDEGSKLQTDLMDLDQQIAALEEDLSKAKTELEEFRVLVKKTSALQEEIEKISIEIQKAKQKDKVSAEVLQRFILLLNYLKPAMDARLEEMNHKLKNASAIVNKEVMREYIEREAVAYLRKEKEREQAIAV